MVSLATCAHGWGGIGAHMRMEFSRIPLARRVQVTGAHTTLHHATPCWAACAAHTFVTIARRWRALARCCAFGDGRQQAGTCQEAARHLVRSLSGVPSRRSRPPVLSSPTETARYCHAHPATVGTLFEPPTRQHTHTYNCINVGTLARCAGAYIARTAGGVCARSGGGE